MTPHLRFVTALFFQWMHKNDPIFELLLKGKRVLDMGCGEGKLLKKAPSLIHGIDINEEMLKQLSAEQLLVKKGSVTNIPYEDRYFEAVHCSNIIEHLTPAEAYQMFFEIKRVLKSEGIVIIITPMPTTVWNTFGHIKPYPPMAIKKLFRDVSLESFEPVSGFQIEEVFYYGVWGRNKLLFIISTLIAQWTPFLRGSYLMVIRKKV
jgi:ubiquinone/menaquinone biosynthesis C-methylase UbiE